MTDRTTPSGQTKNEPPARRHAAIGRDVVERVMLNLWSLPARIDRAPLTKLLEAAMASLALFEEADLMDSAHLDRLDAAIARVEEARAALASADDGPTAVRSAKSLAELEGALTQSREETVSLIISLQDRMLHARARADEEKPLIRPFRASVGLPNLHVVEGSAVPLGIRVEAPEHASGADGADDSDEDEDDFDDDDDIDKGALDEAAARALGGAEEGAAGARSLGAADSASGAGASATSALASGEPIAQSELASLRRVARDCMEEIGSLGTLRSTEGRAVPWIAGAERFERRLLASLDALIALGTPFIAEGQERRLDVLAELMDYAGSAFVPDPTRAFARAFVLGCIDGEDSVRAAVIGLRQSNKMTYAIQKEALALASNPAIGPAMQRLSAEGNTALTRVALDVLRMRREAALEVLPPFLAHPDPGVRISAARALAVVPARAAAARLLEMQVDSEDDDRVVLAIAESLLAQGAPAGLALVRRRLLDDLEYPGAMIPAARFGFLRLLGVAGGASDADIIARSFRASPHEASAAGFLGHPALISKLLIGLEQSEGVSSRAAFARAAARALHRITGLGQREGDPRPLLPGAEVPVDSAFWRARIEQSGERFTQIQKYRFGIPYTPMATIAEAEAGETLSDVRGDLALELAVLSGGASRFDAHDWVVRQRAELTSLRELFAPVGKAPAHPPGEWPVLYATSRRSS